MEYGIKKAPQVLVRCGLLIQTKEQKELMRIRARFIAQRTMVGNRADALFIKVSKLTKL